MLLLGKVKSKETIWNKDSSKRIFRSESSVIADNGSQTLKIEYGNRRKCHAFADFMLFLATGSGLSDTDPKMHSHRHAAYILSDTNCAG